MDRTCADCLVNQLNVFTNRGTRCSDCSKKHHKLLVAAWKRENRGRVNFVKRAWYMRRKLVDNDRV